MYRYNDDDDDDTLPEGRFIGFYAIPGYEMREVVSLCLPHRQLWVNNLSKVATQWLEVDSNLRPFGCKAPPRPIDTIQYGIFSFHQ